MRYSFIKKINKHLIAIDNEKGLNVFNINNNDISFYKRLEFNLNRNENFRTIEFINSLNQIVIGRNYGIVEFIDFETLDIKRKIKLPLSDDYYLYDALDILALAPNEKWLAIGQTWYTAYPLNLETNCAKEISIPAQPLRMKYSNDSKYIGIIHGEQGGNGLVVYRQSEDGEWIVEIEKWAVDTFSYSTDSNKVYYFCINKNDKGMLTCQNLADNKSIIWEKEYNLCELGISNINDYGLPVLKTKGNRLIFGIKSSVLLLNELDGEIILRKEIEHQIIDFESVDDNIWLATSDGIERIQGIK